MIRHCQALGGTLLILGLAGCLSGAGDSAEIEAKLSEAERRITELEGQSKSFETRLASQLQRERDGKAYLDPSGDGGYGVVHTELGILLVSMSSVSPKADGAEIVLKIGNLSAATFAGAEAEIGYNVRFDGSPDWADKTRTIKTKIANPIRAASWNKMSTSLPGLRPDQLGFLSVTVTPNEVRLVESGD
ncbi:DUF3251 domain-containing protein [Stenotrophomonas sp. BIGb0135]|uniref:DUF3251 domain-containing protein n=1 Tax=Stenotrophomonas sp. BIGb0135 TaxID=2940620 RepID=UPI00216915A6|nr:DUF3251 domain-containing protein [Stenotrophomonas sp. BIGb0135]MCS4236658.1 hypothetical protein [Stenotrophomonas sp. BIGb0135]